MTRALGGRAGTPPAIDRQQMFDTHAIARSLTAADLTPEQADAITAAVRQAAEHEAAGLDFGTVVTKTDLRAEIAGVDARLAALELRLIKCIVGTGLAAAGMVIAALRLLG